MTDEELNQVAQIAEDQVARNLILRGHYGLARRYMVANDGEAISMSDEELMVVRESSYARCRNLTERMFLVKESA